MGSKLSEVEHAASARQATAASVLRGSPRYLACINKLSLDTRAAPITVRADDRPTDSPPLRDSPAGFLGSWRAVQ